MSNNKDSSYTKRSSNDSSGRDRDSRDRFAGFRVYVGDIGERMNKTDLEREFGQYGQVTDVWMGRKREESLQNYAFVVYRYPEDADEAVRDRNGRKVCGRKVRVEHAKPINSNPRRSRGGWNGGGSGGSRGNYYSQRRDMHQRRSGDRYYNRRGSSQSPVRNSRSRQSPTARRNDSFSDSSPKKSLKRSCSSSESPESRHQKSKQSRKQDSSSPSPPPLSRSTRRAQDSDSGSSSSSSSRKKRNLKKRTRSPESPPANNEYDARQYQKQDKGSDGGKAKDLKSKSYSKNDDYSSDDN